MPFTDDIHKCDLPWQVDKDEVKAYWICDICGTSYRVKLREAYKWFSPSQQEWLIAEPSITFEHITHKSVGAYVFPFDIPYDEEHLTWHGHI